MDSFRLGRLIGELEQRLEALEAEWEKAKHYGRRAILLLALMGAAAIGHMDTLDLAKLLQEVARLLGWLVG